MIIAAEALVVNGTTMYSPGWLAVGPDGTVLAVSDKPIAPAAVTADGGEAEAVVTAGLVVPGFVDIHNHGVGGTDNVSTYWRNPTHSLGVCGRAGTTSMLATLVMPTASTSHVGCAAGLECAHVPSTADAGAPSGASSASSMTTVGGGGGGGGGGVDAGAGAGAGRPLVPPEELVKVVGVVLPGCAVCEGIHAEGPIIADYGGLPGSETVMLLPG